MSRGFGSHEGETGTFTSLFLPYSWVNPQRNQSLDHPPPTVCVQPIKPLVKYFSVIFTSHIILICSRSFSHTPFPIIDMHSFFLLLYNSLVTDTCLPTEYPRLQTSVPSDRWLLYVPVSVVKTRDWDPRRQRSVTGKTDLCWSHLVPNNVRNCLVWEVRVSHVYPPLI